MRPILPYFGASLAALALTWANPVKAQEEFKDVPADHWAYNAVSDLHTRGIIDGYPDNYFRGKRTLTRYEFAIALKRALDKIAATPGATGPQGPAGSAGPAGADGAAGPAGPPGMTPDEVLALRNLTNEFRNELTSLGANIKTINDRLDTMSRDIADIKDQLSRLPKVNVDAFIGVRNDRSRFAFADYSGAFRNASSSHFGPTDVLHDIHVPITATLPGNIKLFVDPVLSNYLSYRQFGGDILGSGAAANQGNGAAGSTSLTEQFSLYQAKLDIPIGGPTSNFKLTVGRYKYQITPGTYYRPDYDAYFDVPDYDDGNYVQDGAKLEAKFGSARTTFFAASFGTPTTSINPTATFNRPTVGVGYAGPFAFGGGNGLSIPINNALALSGATVQANQTAGFHVALPFGKIGELGITAVDFSTNAAVTNGNVTPFNNVAVYGANVTLKNLGHFTFHAEGAKSVTGIGLNNNGTSASEISGNEDNLYYNLVAGYHSGAITLTGGYLYVDPRYGAPGYWDKLGNWYNPTNIKGPTARAEYRLSNKGSLYFGGEYFTGARNRNGAAGTSSAGFLQISDEIYHGVAGAKYVINKLVTLGADYDGVFYSLSNNTGATLGYTGTGRAKPIEQFITLNAGLNLAANTTLKVGYQIISYSSLNSNLLTTGSNLNAAVFTTQLAVHF